MAEQERINRNVNELSQKLLEGCKLLSDSVAVSSMARRTL